MTVLAVILGLALAVILYIAIAWRIVAWRERPTPEALAEMERRLAEPVEPLPRIEIGGPRR